MLSAQRWWKWAELAAWIGIAVAGLVVATQAFGWHGNRWVAVVQSLTPYLGVIVATVAPIAVWRRWTALGTTAVAVGVGLFVLTVPLVFPDDQRAADPGTIGTTIASVNLLFTNDRVDEVADELAELAPDILVLAEFTKEHRAVFRQHPLAAGYPHRVDRSRQGADGIALWSRYPLVPGDPVSISRSSVDVTVTGPDGEVRVLGAHPPTPIDDFDRWRRDLSRIEQVGRRASGPMVVVGDLNATYWHPVFRDLLDAGFVDAHIAAGRGFATSWPTDWVVPAFVQLDHALTTGGLVSTEVVDVDVPGSDHRGFVVTVAPAR